MKCFVAHLFDFVVAVTGMSDYSVITNEPSMENYVAFDSNVAIVRSV